MLIRFITSILFFMNLYWALMLAMSHRSMMWIPISSFLSLIIAHIDQSMAVKDFRHEHLHWSKYIYYYDFIIGFIVLLVCLKDPQLLFPFLTNKNFSYALCIFTLLLILIGIWNIHSIQKNIDRGYLRVQEFIRKINVNGGQ